MGYEIADRIRARRVAALLALVAVGAVVLWLFVLKEDEPSTGVGEPRAVSESELAEFAASVDRPVYWAGPEPDTTYELTEMPNGNTFIRYLDSDAPVGDGSAGYLTVATYPVKDSVAVLESAAEAEGAIAEKTVDGALAVTHEQQATSVYLADESSGYQVEVYDPRPEQALELTLSGTVAPIPTS